MTVEKTRRLPAEFGIGCVLALVVLYFAWHSPDFRSVANVRLLAKSSAQLAVVATGMTLVIATGGIDASVGSVMGLCAMTLGWLVVRMGWPLWAACLASVGVGGLCGLVNGTLIARFKIPPIIATLAMFAGARAGASLFNQGHALPDEGQSLPLLALNEHFDKTQIAGGIPILFVVGIAALIVGGLVLRRTTFGRTVLAFGGNRQTTRLSGIPIVRLETLVYVISGALAGAAAVLNVASKASATPDAGQYLELIAITAVVLGGTAITGGEATTLGTGLGVLTIGALLSGVRSLQQEDQVAWFLVGAALLLAVEVQNWRRRRTDRRSGDGAQKAATTGARP